jgi:hypothetical protein
MKNIIINNYKLMKNKTNNRNKLKIMKIIKNKTNNRNKII